ncbi:MAG: flagellar biosynthetic protein FliR, partial [Bacillota bacterium]|nr:flagellar biosynthetic protein FliR [Bacillota bacterium]
MQYSLPLLDLILVGARLAGMIFTAPFFGSRNYPVPIKIGLVLFTTILINPLVTSNILYDVSNVWDFAYHLTNEIFIGLFIGIILTVYFNFVYFAGDIIDRDLGFAMVNVVNPMDESQIPITANLFYIFSILIFLQLNLHHQLITAL